MADAPPSGDCREKNQTEDGTSMDTTKSWGEADLLDALGWPKLRLLDLGQVTWLHADRDFNSYAAVVLRERGAISFSLTRSGLEGQPERLAGGRFAPSEDDRWASAQEGGTAQEAADAVALFRHWVDGVAALPKFMPLGRAAEPGSAQPADQKSEAGSTVTFARFGRR
jgi:hypothetical protein